MAFFKFRKDGAEPAAPAPAPESLEALRKRARHRLMGAAALVLLGVVGFPLLFDSQPRPIDVDIAISIPDKSKVAPLAASPTVLPASQTPQPAKEAPAEKETTISSAAADPTPAPAPEKAAVKAVAQAAAPADSKAESKPAAKPESKAEPKTEAKSVAKAEPKVADGKAPAEAAKAQTLLEGKDPGAAAAPAGARYVVQVGAFAEVHKAQDARRALEKAGLKTYTQVVSTSDGKRTRVRAGPYATKAEVDKAAEKIKSLNLPAQILTL